VKDPLIALSDDWQFPTNGLPGIGWIGQVHRGTPWQTLYLKSAVTDIGTWMDWVGDEPADAQFSHPTNDWQLAGLLDELLNTNNFQQLLSVNNPNTNAWQAVLNGFQVLTNATQPGVVVIKSNSAQAAIIANGISAMRGSAIYNGTFKQLGDILSVPELTLASPYLGSVNLSSSANTNINDAVLESIPLQLLPLLRPDSFGSIGQNGSAWQIQFSGMDGCAYATQVSSNLLDWMSVATNYPSNGIFDFTDPAPASGHRFYRSLLLP
jgi:hypothetical protein